MIHTLFVHTSFVVFGMLMIGDYCKKQQTKQNEKQKYMDLQKCYEETYKKKMPRIAEWTFDEISKCKKPYLDYIKVIVR